MAFLDPLRDFLTGRSPASPLARRRDRREAARRRHHETGAAAWTADDRHLGPPGEHTVADVTPGTPGHYGSVHTIRDD